MVILHLKQATSCDKTGYYYMDVWLPGWLSWSFYSL